MASGVYGKVDITAATTWTEIVAAPTAGTTKVVTLNLCNRTGSAVTVRVAISDTAGNAGTAGYELEYDSSIPANGVLERTGIVLSENNGLHAYASATGISAVAYGLDG